jgi:hypothetical protein
MGVGSNAGSLDSAGRALDLSFPIIENVLETKLQAGSITDFFDTTTTSKQFRLSNILVDVDSVIVRVGDAGTLFTSEDGTVVAASEYFLSPEKGLLDFRNAPIAGHHRLSVTYDYGLGVKDGVLVAPYWLQEVAIAMAIFVLNTHPSSPANRKEKTVTNVGAALYSLASSLLNSRCRPRLTVVQPSRSVEP